MAPWQSGDVVSNGLRLHYTRTGGAKPPIVLAHGFAADGLCWTTVAEALQGDYDVIMVDARGHGRSEASEQAYGPLELADDLVGVIAALGLRRPAILGHSMGASTALTLAAIHPDIPGAILLEDPPAWWLVEAKSDSPDDGQERERAWLVGMQRKTRDELIAEQRAERPHWPEAELGPIADAMLRLSINVLNRRSPTTLDWGTILPRISCPALLIAGDPARGASLNKQSAAALQSLIPHLRIAHIAHAGHSIRYDQFERYMRAVRAFLHQTEGLREPYGEAE